MASLKKNSPSHRVAIFTLALLLCPPHPCLPSQLNRTPGSPPVQWHLLDEYQFSISRTTFERRVNEFFSRDGEFWKYAKISDQSLTIYSDIHRTIALWTLYFTRPDEEKNTQQRWSPGSGTEDLPLRGLIVCLDPGHIGAEWARTEERWFKIQDDPPIIEWDLNIITARHIEQQLKQLGATVVWTKTQPVPVTTQRPETLRPVALLGLWRYLSDDVTTGRFRTIGLHGLDELLRQESERSFYRYHEITARAEIVRQLHPDITLTIHFNAAPWGDPENPRLVNTNHLVIFIHGSYTAEELQLQDHRFHLVRKALANDIATERAVAEEIARQYARIWPQWRPANYGAPDWAMPLPESPYVYARNLLANRVFDGPVVFVEGPFMNAADTYPRLLAGDYEGEKIIAGKKHRSIFREFAETVVEGLKEYFTRGNLPDPPLPSFGETPSE
jgi:N-acetylmuramoyl-L-alanine amidase